MNTNTLSELKYDPLRDKVTSLRGEFDIKNYKNGGRYVNYKGSKVSLGNIAVYDVNEPDLTTIEGWQELYEKNILHDSR